MTGRTLRLVVDPTTVSPSRTLEGAAQCLTPAGAPNPSPPLVVTHRALSDLADELGGLDAALRFLARLAERTGTPIGVNVPTVDGSRTTFLAPRSWTTERLRGWVAGHHAALEAEYGPATVVEEPAR